MKKLLADGVQHRLSVGYQLRPIILMSTIGTPDASDPDSIGGNRYRVFLSPLTRHEVVEALAPSHRLCRKFLGMPSTKMQRVSSFRVILILAGGTNQCEWHKWS